MQLHGFELRISRSNARWLTNLSQKLKLLGGEPIIVLYFKSYFNVERLVEKKKPSLAWLREKGGREGSKLAGTHKVYSFFLGTVSLPIHPKSLSC